MEAPDLPHVDDSSPGSACRVIPPHLGMPLLTAVRATCKLIMGPYIIMIKVGSHTCHEHSVIQSHPSHPLECQWQGSHLCPLSWPEHLRAVQQMMTIGSSSHQIVLKIQVRTKFFLWKLSWTLTSTCPVSPAKAAHPWSYLPWLRLDRSSTQPWSRV